MRVHSIPPAAESPVRVTARLFGQYAELAGVEAMPLVLPPGAVAADAIAAIRRTVPNGARLPERPLIAINLAHARPDQPLADGDDVAVLPPLAGG